MTANLETRLKKTGASSQSLLEKIINTSLDGVVAYDREYRYIMFNEAMENLTGLPKEKVLGRVCYEVFPFLKVTVVPFIDRAFKGETVKTVEARYSVASTRREGYFDAVYSPVFSVNGEITTCVGVIREVTERRQREQAFLESELKYRALTQNANDAIISFDADGNLLSFNAGATKLFDYEEKEVSFANVSVILPSSFWKGYVALAIKNTESGVLERAGRASDLFLHRKGGSSFPADVTLSSWVVNNRFFFSAIIRDMSKTHHLEAIAEEQEDLYQALMQTQSDMGEGVVITNVERSKYFYVNEAMCKLLGYSRDELMKLNPTDPIAPEHKEMLLKRILKNDEGLSSVRVYETVLIRKDGSSVNAEVSFKAVETSYGPSIVTLVRDISHRKETEDALFQSEIQMREILKSAADMITFIDLNGVLQSINPAVENQSGFESSDLVNQNYSWMIHPDDLPICARAVQQVSEGKKPAPYVVRAIKKDGSYYSLEVSSTPVVRAHRVVGMLSISRDITQRIKQHHELKDEQLKFRALTEAAFEGICFTEAGVIIEANPSFIQMFGHAPEETVGLHFSKLCAPGQDDVVRKNIAVCNNSPFKALGLKKDGSTFEVEIRGRLIEYKSKPVRVFAVREVVKS